MPSGTITSIALQSGDRERVNIFIDGAFAIGLDLQTMQQEGLYKGQQISDEDWTRIERAASAHKAWNAALRLLEVRPRTEREIRDRLRRKQYEPEHIDRAIARLRDLELLDDAQFARLWVASRAATKPKGAMALRRELLNKGVDRTIASEAVAAAVDDDTESASCEQVARQAARRYASVADWPTFQRKLGALLQRRGYGWNTAKPILQKLWQERGEEPLDDAEEAP
jgi:regulatory protein